MVTGIEKYSEYLKKIGRIKIVGEFYLNIFNMPRDSFYKKNNVRIILLLNQQEYDMFLSEYGDDFLSYAQIKENIDIMLQKSIGLKEKQRDEER